MSPYTKGYFGPPFEAVIMRDGKRLSIDKVLAALNALEEALGDLIEICAPNIYPKPDVDPQHPWAVLQRAREALSTSDKAGG